MSKLILGDTAISATEPSGPQRRRFFGRKKKERPVITHCENCGAELQGRYCGICGQPAIDYRRSFGHVMLDVLNEFLNWDSKFFASVGFLIVKPWRLTNEFLAGHRVRYVHPLRLYLLASILFFFAATYGIKSAHFQPLNLSPEDRAEIRSDLERENLSPEIREKIEQALEGKAIAPEKRARLEEQLKNEALPKEARDAIQERLDHGDLPPNPREEIDKAMKDLPPEARAKIEKSLKNASDEHGLFQANKNEPPNSVGNWLQTRAREKFGEHGSNIQLFLVTLISNLPYMMLACIPLFAFVLKILYIRRKIFYIDHLIYALHIHSFAYIAIMSIVLITLGLNHVMPGTITACIIAALWVTFAVQIFLSIRRVYRQGWFFSIFKFFLGGFVYLFVIIFALAATFFVTLALP